MIDSSYTIASMLCRHVLLFTLTNSAKKITSVDPSDLLSCNCFLGYIIIIIIFYYYNYIHVVQLLLHYSVITRILRQIFLHTDLRLHTGLINNQYYIYIYIYILSNILVVHQITLGLFVANDIWSCLLCC